MALVYSASGVGGDCRAEVEYLNEMSAQVEAIAVGGESLMSDAMRLSTTDPAEFELVIGDYGGLR